MKALVKNNRESKTGSARARAAWVSVFALALSTVAAAQPERSGRRDDRSGPGARRERLHPPDEDRDGPPLPDKLDGRPGPFRGRPKPWSEWPAAERRQIEKFIEDNFPRIYVELHQLKEQNERRFDFRMTRMAPQMKRIMETLKVDPPRGTMMIRERQVEMDIFQTMLQYRQATDGATKDRLKSKLTELATQAFDFRHQRRQDEIRDLETRLDLLKSRLTDSQHMRSELIRRHVEEILQRPPPPLAAEEEDRPPPPPEEEP